ncbi:MAG: GNAT family N-acetyltransferase [Clostridia bacterium]
MNFTKFDNEAKRLLAIYLKDTGYTGSDFSYQAFLCWYDDLEYAECDGVLFLRAFANGEIRYWQPLIKIGSDKTMKQAIEMLPEGSSFAWVTEQFKNQLGDDYVCCSNRNWSEYIYNTKEFIELAGNKFSAKRNHIVRFKKLYNSAMTSFKEEDLDDFMSLECQWLQMHKFDERMTESAQKESNIVRGWIEAVLAGELICDVLRVDGKVIGVAIGEIEPSGNSVIMFEKADRNYEGVYSYIAHEFIVRNFSQCEFMNRQEDLGIEGLKKSKMSYNPCALLDKYMCIPKENCDVDENGEYIMPCEGDSSLDDEDDEYYEIISRHEMLTDEFSTERNKIDAKIEEIKNATLDKYVIRRLMPRDFNITMTFFENSIRNLEDKLFFKNFTDEELIDILKGGYMLGAFYENHLIATCACDLDREYGDKLAEICGDTSGKQFYEFSGIMVCRYHRNKGLGREICKKAIEYAFANLKNSTLCAVVQFNNIPSLKNLAGLGFKEVAEQAEDEYNFKYLTLQI